LNIHQNKFVRDFVPITNNLINAVGIWLRAPNINETSFPALCQPAVSLMENLWLINTEDWQEMFRMRRLVEPNDLMPVNNPNLLAYMHNLWCERWLNDNLTMEQRRKKRSQKTNIFNAWLRQHYGNKHLVMAILETGLSWGTTSGAAEHFAAACHASDHGIAIVDPQQTMAKWIEWIVQVVKAIDMHKNEPSVKKKRNEAYKHVITRFKTKGEYNLPKAKHSGSASGANDNSKMMVDPQQTIT